jgi:hypothetical protein
MGLEMEAGWLWGEENGNGLDVRGRRVGGGGPFIGGEGRRAAYAFPGQRRRLGPAVLFPVLAALARRGLEWRCCPLLAGWGRRTTRVNVRIRPG